MFSFLIGWKINFSRRFATKTTTKSNNKTGARSFFHLTRITFYFKLNVMVNLVATYMRAIPWTAILNEGMSIYHSVNPSLRSSIHSSVRTSIGSLLSIGPLHRFLVILPNRTPTHDRNQNTCFSHQRKKVLVRNSKW